MGIQTEFDAQLVVAERRCDIRQRQTLPYPHHRWEMVRSTSEKESQMKKGPEIRAACEGCEHLGCERDYFGGDWGHVNFCKAVEPIRELNSEVTPTWCPHLKDAAHEFFNSLPAGRLRKCKGEDEIENLVLSILENHPEIRFSQVRDYLPCEVEVNEGPLREAIWRLIDRRIIEWSSDYRLKFFT